MKKIFLLAATALVGFNADAQLAESFSISGGSAKQPVLPFNFVKHQPSAKSSIAGGRWYNHAAIVNDVIVSGQMDMGIFPIWFDSSVTQTYIDGPGTINWSSLGQVVDPIHFTLWNDVNVSDPNTIAITMEAPYKVDSVSFGAYYVTNLARPATVVDTLIFSVSTAGNDEITPIQSRNPNSPNWTNNNYTCTNCPDSTLKAWRITPADSINRASGVNNVVMWKVPIDTSFRRPDSAGFIFFREFTYPVMVNGTPGVANIPPGRVCGVTVTFKSGDITIPGDSFDAYHHMYMSSGEAIAGTAMPYYHYVYRDRNSSNLMFSTDPSFYAATIIIEGVNTIDFRQEFHDISAHLVCDDCPTVAEYSSVQNVNSSVGTDMTAYPNPANNEINVSFIMNQNTNATVSISNAVGQVIATQKVGNVIAKQNNTVTFSTATLSAGIYFYTVEAKGQRSTNRFVVSH